MAEDVNVRIFALVLATMASQALLVVLGPTVVAISSQLGAQVGVVGQARTVTAAVALATSLLLTGWLERVGVRRLIAAGAVMAVVASAIVAGSRSLAWFLLAHVAIGLALALLLSGGFAGVADLAPSRRSAAFGYVAGANSLAWIVVNPLAGLLTEAASWRLAHLVPAAFSLAALAFTTAIPATVTGPSGTRLKDVLGGANARRWVYSETIAYAAWVGFLTFAGAFFIQTLSLGEAAAGWLLATGPAAYYAAAVIGGRLGGALPRRPLVAVAAFAMAALLVAQFGVTNSLAWAATVFCLVGFFGGVRTPASAGLGMSVAAGHPAAMMAVRTAAVQAGTLLGAATTGAVIATGGYGGLGWLMASGMVLSGLLVLTVREGQ